VIFLTTSLEVSELATRTAQPIAYAAEIFHWVGARFAFDALREMAWHPPARIPPGKRPAWRR
jgi:hypothetical protein